MFKSQQSKTQKLSEIKRLFDTVNRENGLPRCVYCGVFVATDLDHVIPRSYIEDMEELKRLGVDVDVPDTILVNACKFCNCTASNKVFKNFKEKRKYLREQFAKHYRRYLTLPHWSDDEINELSGKLKEQVYWENRIANDMKERFLNAQ